MHACMCLCMRRTGVLHNAWPFLLIKQLSYRAVAHSQGNKASCSTCGGGGGECLLPGVQFSSRQLPAFATSEETKDSEKTTFSFCFDRFFEEREHFELCLCGAESRNRLASEVFWQGPSEREGNVNCCYGAGAVLFLKGFSHGNSERVSVTGRQL